jgi:hypothetical protein
MIQITPIEVLFFTAAFGVIQFVLAKWIEGRISNRFAKFLEDYKYDIKVREQAAKIADFFAEWTLGAEADKAKLNRYSMELSLWLPYELYSRFARCVTYQPGAPIYKDILIDIRKHLLKTEAGEMKAGDIVHF